MSHIPVLLKETLEILAPRPGENLIDATIGGGGHAFAILEKISPTGMLLGIDANKVTVEDLKKRIEEVYPEPRRREIKERLILVCDNFSNLQNIVREHSFAPVHGVLADIGFSSTELASSGRGFSFLREEALDMRYGEGDLTAEKIINSWPEEDLASIFQEYGEERFSRPIARCIVSERRVREIKTTFQLIEIIKRATPAFYHHRRLNPATKIFQALRIAVNNELDNLKKFLPQAVEILSSGGRLVIISFHSLEDRIVKNFLREQEIQGIIKILTKKIIKPGADELNLNPRSSSAKLRAAIKI